MKNCVNQSFYTNYDPINNLIVMIFLFKYVVYYCDEQDQAIMNCSFSKDVVSYPRRRVQTIE